MLDEKLIIMQLPGYAGWKDLNLRYVACNQNFADYHNCKQVTDVIGLQDADFINMSSAELNFHRHNDARILQGETMTSTHQADNGLYYSFIKKPLFDTRHKIIGLMFQCHMLQMAYTANPFQLSPRELQTLQLVAKGFSSSKIGQQLKLSARTVESYIENIKNKFGVRSKAEMVIFAVRYSYV